MDIVWTTTTLRRSYRISLNLLVWWFGMARWRLFTLPALLGYGFSLKPYDYMIDLRLTEILSSNANPSNSSPSYFATAQSTPPVAIGYFSQSISETSRAFDSQCMWHGMWRLQFENWLLSLSTVCDLLQASTSRLPMGQNFIRCIGEGSSTPATAPKGRPPEWECRRGRPWAKYMDRHSGWPAWVAARPVSRFDSILFYSLGLTYTAEMHWTWWTESEGELPGPRLQTHRLWLDLDCSVLAIWSFRFCMLLSRFYTCTTTLKSRCYKINCRRLYHWGLLADPWVTSLFPLPLSFLYYMVRSFVLQCSRLPIVFLTSMYLW
jgi:hypothetical protein